MNTAELTADHGPDFQATIKAVQAASKRGERAITVTCGDPARQEALLALGKAYEIKVQFGNEGENT